MFAQSRQSVRVPVASYSRTGHTTDDAKGVLHSALIYPVVRDPSATCFDGNRLVCKHIRQQPGLVKTRRTPGRGGRSLCSRRCNTVASTGTRDDQTKRDEPLISLGDRVRAQIVVFRQGATDGRAVPAGYVPCRNSCSMEDTIWSTSVPSSLRERDRFSVNISIQFEEKNQYGLTARCRLSSDCIAPTL